jgi:WD40-like Beta Propeller Repeat
LLQGEVESLSTNDIAELLRKGIEAARESKRSEARNYFEQVVELDEKNEKGWFWLASVVDTDEERRICLSNVLHINPNNERAKRALTALDAKSKDKKLAAAVQDAEVIAGVTRRQVVLIAGGGAAAIFIILLIALVVIVANNNRQGAEQATAQAIAQVAADSLLTATEAAVQSTATAASIAATQLALIPPTVPTSVLATLPPTWTPTPQATGLPTSDILPPPIGLPGRLVMWGGEDTLKTGYLPLGYYDFDRGTVYAQIGTSFGKNIRITPNGQRTVYTVYDQLLFSSSLEADNLNGTQIESVPERWQDTGTGILVPQMPSWGPFGLSIVFVGRPQNAQNLEVFIVDLNPPAGSNPVRQVTSDAADYTYPAFSPDGKKIAVVRTDQNAAVPTVDIVSIDVATGGKIPITNDAGSYVETSPRWTKDGSQIYFAAAASNDPNNADIYVKNSNGTGSTLPLYRDPSDNLFPVLSPDGRYLAFASNAGGSYDIYIWDQQDSKLSRLTNTPDQEFPGDWWEQGN